MSDRKKDAHRPELAKVEREGLKALIERESARRLAALGGSEKQLQPVSRRRPDMR